MKIIIMLLRVMTVLFAIGMLIDLSLTFVLLTVASVALLCIVEYRQYRKR